MKAAEIVACTLVKININNPLMFTVIYCKHILQHLIYITVKYCYKYFQKSYSLLWKRVKDRLLTIDVLDSDLKLFYVG